jgi:hypothetical protein
MRWAGHVQRMPEERVVKKIFTGQPGWQQEEGKAPTEMGGRFGGRSEENRNKRMEEDGGG